MTEHQLQVQIFTYHWNNYPDQRRRLFHVNNKTRNAIEGKTFQLMGVIPGVSDFILIKPGSILFIELKTDAGFQSAEQKQFQQIVESCGHTYKICRSLADFLQLL